MPDRLGVEAATAEFVGYSWQQPNLIRLFWPAPFFFNVYMPLLQPQPPYIKRTRLHNMPPLLDVQAAFEPGLTIIIGKPGTGKSRILMALEELADLRAYKYAGADSELVLGGRLPLTITLKEDYRSLAYYEKQFVARAINREAFETLVASLPRKRNGQLPLLTVVAKGKKTADNYSINAALQELHSYYPLYTLKSVGPEIPPAQLLFVEKPATFKSFKTPLGSGQQQEQLECIPVIRSFNDIFEYQLVYALRGALPLILTSSPQTASQFDDFRLLAQRSIGVHLARLNAYLPIYSPIQAVRLSEQLQAYRDAKTDDLFLKNVVLEYRVDGEWVPFDALTEAAKRIFYLIGEISAAYSSVQGALAGIIEYHKLILLDEPALSLPADEQQRLFRFIHEAAQNHQIILATDEPQALDILEPTELDHILICSYAPEAGTQLRPLSPSQKAEISAHLSRQGLLSEWWYSAGL